jgi:hypothetical protein
VCISLRYDFSRLRAALRDDLRLPPARHRLQDGPAGLAAAPQPVPLPVAVAAGVSSSGSSGRSNGGSSGNSGSSSNNHSNNNSSNEAAREALRKIVRERQRALSEALQALLRLDAHADGSDELEPEPSTVAMVVTSSYRMDSHIIGTGRFNDPFVREVVADVLVSAALDRCAISCCLPSSDICPHAAHFPFHALPSPASSL